MSTSLVLDPGLNFDSLQHLVGTLGFTRDASVRPVTADIIPGEPELAAWTRGQGERLTYTFNPVVSLRVLQCAGLADDFGVSLAERLPLLGSHEVGRMLEDSDTRRVLLGLLAARVLRTQEHLSLVVSLAGHHDAVIRRAAESTLEALAFGAGATAREKTLAVMQALCQRAAPRLAALVGPDGSRQLEQMRPQATDFARVFHPDIAGDARVAFEELWLAPPPIERLDSGRMTLTVQACPAGMLREENELSRHFPGGYLALAPHLVADRIWFVWRYVMEGHESGMRYDGVVMLDDRLVWFPKPHRVVGEILGAVR